MSRATSFSLLFLAGLFAVGRFTLVSGHRPLSVAGSYEAAAHLFVGGLLGAWLATRHREYLYLAAALSAVELAAFLTLGRG